MPRSYEDWEAPEYPVAAPEWEMGQLRRQVQVLTADLRHLNGLLAEKDRAIQDLERIRATQARRIAVLIRACRVQAEEIDSLTRRLGERGAAIRRESEQEIEQLRGLNTWQADEIKALTEQADAQRQQRKLASAEVERLSEALRLSNYQRDNAVADRTIAQAVATKAWEEAKALRQHVEELRRQVTIR